MKYKVKGPLHWFEDGQVITQEDVQGFKRKVPALIRMNCLEPVFEEGDIPKPEPKPVVEEEPDFDLNNDGKVDDEDASIAAKVMNKVRHNKKKKRGRK